MGRAGVCGRRGATNRAPDRRSPMISNPMENDYWRTCCVGDAMVAGFDPQWPVLKLAVAEFELPQNKQGNAHDEAD